MAKVKTVSLTRYVTRILLLAFSSVIAILILSLILFQILISTGKISPANAGETAARKDLAHLEESKVSSSKLKSKFYHYIYFTEAGKVQETSLSGTELKRTLQQYKNRNEEYSTGAYVTFSDGSYALLTWQYKAQFTNETLRKLFPNFEILFLIGIAFILIAYFIWFTKKTSNYLQVKLALVEQASLQIAQENLDSKIDDSTDIMEFNHVLQSMEGMRVALKESLVQQWETQEQRKQEIAALTHDINTPLTVINGNAELLLEESLDSEQQQLVQHIYESGLKTKQYIDLLQQVSNFDVVHEEKEQISLEDVKEELAQVLSQLARQKEIALEVQLETMTTIVAAPTMLMRALVNLGENAIRYTEVGKVMIRMEKQHQKIFFVFEDNGPGFSSEALVHGKEMFWQQDQSRSDTSNYGIGLSIVERVAQYHKGELRLENTQKGGKVTLILSNE